MLYTTNLVIIDHLPPIKGTRNSYWWPPPSLGPPKDPPHDVLMLSSPQLMFVVAGILLPKWMKLGPPPHGKKGQSYIPSLRIEFWIKSCKHSANHLTLKIKQVATISFDLVREGMHESTRRFSNFCKKIFFSCWWMCMSSSFEFAAIDMCPNALDSSRTWNLESGAFSELPKENGSKPSHWIL